MSEITWILGATFGVAVLAWIGIFTLALKERTFKKILLLLVSFAAGTLIGGAFLHLIPEVFHDLEAGHGHLEAPLFILSGLVFFFILEEFLQWHHCHKPPEEHSKEPFSYLILVSDSIHNLVDGLIIGGSFLVDFSLGVATTFAVAAHEIPQELGNFGILVKGGWKKVKALTVNFLAALMIVPGGLLAYFLRDFISPVYLIAFAAGGFVYIGAADLIPEIHPEEDNKLENLLIMLMFLVGIGVMVLIELYVPHAH